MTKSTRQRRKTTIFGTTRRAVTLPIDNPLREKEFIEGRRTETWLRYLFKKAGARQDQAFFISPRDWKERILEVYRLCYEQASGGRRLVVIRDFIAFHPCFVFDAPWLAELSRHQVLNAPTNTIRSNFLQALARGFRQAASPGPQMRRLLRLGALRAANQFRSEIQNKLKEFDRELERPRTTTDRRCEHDISIVRKVRSKLRQLERDYPKVARVSEKLERFLLKGRTYQAATLIAATVYGVRQRSLEGESD